MTASVKFQFNETLTMENIEIRLHGPFDLGRNEKEKILLNSLGKEKRIYLWTIPFENKYLVHYVGETAKGLLLERWST